MKIKLLIILMLLLLACKNSNLDAYKPIDPFTKQKAEVVEALSSGNYVEAKAVLNNILKTSKNNEEKSLAYSGLGFVEMRSSILNIDLDSAYLYFQNAQLQDTKSLDALAGKILLEYSYKKNYLTTIELGQNLYASNIIYKMTFDDKLDINDILLNIALSYYALGNYNSSVITIKKIKNQEAYINLASTKEEKLNLATKLNELIHLHKS